MFSEKFMVIQFVKKKKKKKTFFMESISLVLYLQLHYKYQNQTHVEQKL